MHVTSGRAQLAYEVTGAGADVLLIHAGVTDRRGWAPVVERLAARHRCVAYDQRGYGETTYEPQDGWSAVADAAAVLDAADVQRAVVVAASMGGKVAIDLALAHPERVRALALIGTAVGGAPYPDLAEGATAEVNRRIETAWDAEDLDAVNRLEAWLWLDGPDAPEGRVGGDVRQLFLDMNGPVLRAPEPGTEAEMPAAWPRLAELAVPTLLLVGRLDAEDIRVVDEQAAARIPGAELVWLDGVAHLPHLEGDAATLEAVERFVDAHAG